MIIKASKITIIKYYKNEPDQNKDYPSDPLKSCCVTLANINQ